jgi:hypothetical protein
MHPSGNQFNETPAYWVAATQFLQSETADRQALGIWVVSVDGDNDVCSFNFPQPATGGPYTNMVFASSGEYLDPPYLNAFDVAGQKILLEIEPGRGNITTEIQLVLNQYGSYPCVAGISIDAEWILPNGESANPDGQPVTNAEAQSWLMQIDAYNPNYLLNIVHWETNHMPPTYRNANLILENDGEDNESYAGFQSSCQQWASAFPGANLGFMVGFDSDWPWIKNITNPAGTIMNWVFNNIPNTQVVYWAGWTMPDIYTGTQ